MKKRIKKVLNNNRKWLENNGLRIYNRDIKFLNNDLENSSRQAFQQMNLKGLGTYFGIKGITEITNGNKDGWKYISIAIDFLAWSLKIRSECIFSQPKLDTGGTSLNLYNYVSIAACLICVSDKWSNFAKSILYRINTEPTYVGNKFWSKRKFEPFVLKCCQFQEEIIDFPTTDAVNEPYKQVISSWHDNNQLKNALFNICDYHCLNMEDSGGDWKPEFCAPPFQLIPCEIMFINRVRKCIGLSTPDIDHDLLSVLEINLEFIPEYPEHEIIKRLSSTFHDCFS